MADSPPKLLPAPLPRVEFLKSSHFKIGPDPRLQEGCMKTTFGSWFPAHWGVHAAAPFLPGPSKGLFHQDLEKIREINSEMHTAFPVHDTNSFQSSSNPLMQTSSLKMHGDPRINVFKTICQEKYTYPGPEDFNPFTKEALRQFEKDSFPSGDRDKLGFPLSHSRQVFVPQQQFPQARAPCLHLGGPSPLKWEMELFPDTSYQEEFQRKYVSPTHLCEKLNSHLQLGDSKIGLEGIHSEQKNAYTLQDLPQHRYNKKEAVANIFQVHIQPGNGNFHAYLPSSRDEASVDASEPVFKHQTISDSLLLKEDQDPERCRERSNFTTSHHFFTWIRKLRPTEKRLAQSHTMTTPKGPYLPGMDFMTTSRQLGPHSIKRNPVPEEIKERVKYAHILPPQPDHEFSTEYKDNYPFKYIGPLVPQEGNFQESSVPLGLQKRWSGKEVVIPC